jgi:pantoate--beta-alanine ligase
MITLKEPGELRRQIRAWRSNGRTSDAQKSDAQTIGFVPTMGALHRGHLALVEKSCELATKTVASIFVNPTQFGPHEDFDSYPRDVEADAKRLSDHGCDLLFLPSVETIYPPGHCTYVEVEKPSRGMEGELRPGHFRGVATVVTQLFNLVQPDLAVFGDKDAQQLAVIRQLVRDLHIPVEIVAHPTIREDDGLALSSRNAYLSSEQRRAATVLYRALDEARKHVAEGERSAYRLKQAMRSLIATEPLAEIDYAEVVDPETFQPIDELESRAVLPVAIRLGTTRLIDNLQIDTDTSRETDL